MKKICLLLLAIGFCAPAIWAQQATPLLTFPANGNLQYTNSSGKTGVGQMGAGAAKNLRYIQGHSDTTKGLYIPPHNIVVLPVTDFNPREGTLSFWFRPDWAPFSRRSNLILEVDAGAGGRLSFRKGYPHVPDQCYLNFTANKGNGGNISFGPHNLFTGREWRHYAIRWSAARHQIQFVVDGESENSRTSTFNMDIAGPVPARVLLNGDACGAFADVKLFDHYQTTKEIIKSAGLTKVANYLQEQRPPEGATAAASQSFTYTDPATGQKVTLPLPEPEQMNTSDAYNPEQVKYLPETPHTAWAKPLAGGPLRVLFVMPYGFEDGNSLVREGVELWQRLDMHCEITNKYDPAVLRQDYDVIVVTPQGIVKGQWAGWTDLDARLQAWILNRVQSGRSGLVLTYPLKLNAAINALFTAKDRVSSNAIVRGFPTSAVEEALLPRYDKIYDLDDSFFQNPEELSTKIVEAYQDGKVRAVKLNYKSSTGLYSHDGLTPDTAKVSGATLVQYDYWMALAARAIFFAAGRKPQGEILDANVSGGTWTVKLDRVIPGTTLEYRARDIWNWPYASGKVLLPSTSITIKGKQLPPRAVVDFIWRNKTGKVIDWYSAAVPPARSTQLTAIKLDKDFYQRTDTVRGTATIATNHDASRRLDVYLEDEAGRKLVKRSYTPKGTAPVDFVLPIPASSQALLMHVDAELFENGNLIDRHGADCPVPNTNFAGFYFTMYGPTHNRAMDTIRRQWFRDRYGVNTMVHNGNYNYGVLARDNLHQIEYMTHLGYVTDEKSMDAWMQDWNKFFPAHLFTDPQQVQRFEPLFYSLGEEHVMGVQGSANPQVNALFRKYLQQKYGDLKSLNAAWGSHFATWDEVKTATPEVIDMMDFQFDPLRFESRRFMEHLFADKHAFLANYFYKLDPQAHVGIHTGWDLWMGKGYDYWLLSRAMDSMMGYDVSQGWAQNAYIRSFFSHYYGAFNHYYIGGHEDVRWHPWSMLINGAHGFGWYSLGSSLWGATTADLHISSDWKAAAPEYTAAARAGDLLSWLHYDQDQVAIHYSQDSFQASVGSAMTWIHLSYINLLFDAGVPFRFVSYQQMADGDLAKRIPKLLILPHSISLSPLETQAIRTYVSNGGVVWADVLPGTYNNFGQKLKQSQLADMFSNLMPVSLPDGGSLQVGKFGRGTVILGDIGNYCYDRNVGNDQMQQDMLNKIVSLSQVQRVARVVNADDGKTANGVWAGGYHQGEQRYLVVAKDYQIVDKSIAKLRIDIGKEGYVYEMRSGQYLGHTAKIETRLAPVTGKVFAILPYRVMGLRVPQEQMKPQRGQDLVIPVALKTEGKVAANDIHLLRVDVTDPKGQNIEALRRLVVITGGQGAIHLPLAFNDAAGTWTVHITDAATGIRALVSYHIN